MTLTEEIKQFLKSKEGLRLKAYICPAGKWTIGYGNTFYEYGSKVKKGDTISKNRAEELFENILYQFSKEVKSLLKTELNDNQFSALVSFSYNVGIGNFSKSTLLKLVNINPSNPSIKNEFIKWNKGGGKTLYGLTIRRQKEADIYFKEINIKLK
jgi:lysozyme